MKKNQKFKRRNYLKIPNVKISIITIAMIGIIGCGGSDDPISAALNCGSGNWFAQIENQTVNYSKAANDYSDDPTNENCEKYKSAGLEYVKAFKGIVKCVPGSSKNAYDEAFAELNGEINDIDCN